MIFMTANDFNDWVKLTQIDKPVYESKLIYELITWVYERVTRVNNTCKKNIAILTYIINGKVSWFVPLSRRKY